LNLAQATVLVTGGSSGIGFGLAEQFLKAGSTVIITARREDTLNQAKKNLIEKLKIDENKVHTFVNDVATAEGREKLVAHITSNYPTFNVVINNAGVQRKAPIAKDNDPWHVAKNEIEINFEAPIHLSTLFLPHLLKQKEGAIVNVTSGLAFVPAVFAPIYGATKAGLHNYTLSLRYSLSKTRIAVVEIAPPAVKTNLGFGEDRSHSFGEDLDEFSQAVFKKFTEGEPEIGYKMSEEARLASREKIEQTANGLMNFLKVPLVEH